MYHQFDIMDKMSYNTPVVGQNHTDPKGKQIRYFHISFNLLPIELFYYYFFFFKEPEAMAL